MKTKKETKIEEKCSEHKGFDHDQEKHQNCNCQDDSNHCSCEEHLCHDEECSCDCDSSFSANLEECSEIEELKDKVLELEEKLLRQTAEVVNYRKRKDDEIGHILKYANKDLVLEILPILDNFERAISMDDDNLDDEVSRFLEGFKMIYNNFKISLEKFDIKEINGNNKPFDPDYHQAMITEKVKGVEAGMVLEILQKGYLLNDKVIRPAMVKVSE